MTDDKTSDKTEKQAINGEKQAITDDKTSDKSKKQVIKASDKINSLKGISSKTRDNLKKIISYMENHHSVRNPEISEMLGLSFDRSRLLLKTLVDEGCLSISGKNKDRIYTLV